MKIPMKPSNFPEYENSYKIFKYIEYENSCGIFIYLDHDGSHGTLNILTTKIFIFFKYSDYENFQYSDYENFQCFDYQQNLNTLIMRIAY